MILSEVVFQAVFPIHFDYFSEIKSARKSTENQGFLQIAPT